MVRKTSRSKKTATKRKSRRLGGRRKAGVSINTLKKYYPTLKKLSQESSPSRIASILRKIPNSGIDAICECAYNAVHSKSVNKRNLAKLKKLDPNMKKSIRRIIAMPARKRFKERKQLLYQVGGGLGTLIASVLPLLLSLFRKS